MGYWGYKATESDGALDMLGDLASYLEEKWDEYAEEAKTSVFHNYHGELMGIISLLIESDSLDKINFTNLRSKAVFYLNSYIFFLKDPDTYSEDKEEELAYLRILVATLKTHIEATMCDAVTGEVFTSELNKAAVEEVIN